MLDYISNNLNTAQTVLFFCAGWAVGRLIINVISHMIINAGFLKPNYRGEEIPVGLGVTILISSVTVLALSVIFLSPGVREKSTVFLFTLAVFTCLGLMDDFWGDAKCKGLAAHMKSLLTGNPTTGSLKALAGGMAALYISARSSAGPLLFIPVDAVIIALSVNAINLLDLRPGRAGKGFLFIIILVFIAFPLRQDILFASMAAGSLLAYLPLDLKSRAMMGDSGANALGSVLGLTAVWIFDLKLKFFYLAVLVLLHIVAERSSLTRIIASNRLLDYLDRLGRK